MPTGRVVFVPSCWGGDRSGNSLSNLCFVAIDLVPPGGAVSIAEASAGGKWESLLAETKESLEAIPRLIQAASYNDYFRFHAVQTPSWHLQQWTYTNDYIWQGRKGEKRMVTLNEGSEPKTIPFFIAQKALDIDPTASASILPSLAIATTGSESSTLDLLKQLANTLKALHANKGAAVTALDATLPLWRMRTSFKNIKHLAQQTLLERYKALGAECASWILHPEKRVYDSRSVPEKDLKTIWKSLRKNGFGSRREKIQLLKGMAKCLRKIVKVLGRRMRWSPAAVEYCVDELFQKMPAVVDTFRCKLMKTLSLKSRLEIAGHHFERSDLEKIKKLRELRDQIFSEENDDHSNTFLGVRFTTRQALEVVRFLIQQMWEEEYPAVLHDWYETASALVSSSDDDELMFWIVKTLAEVGSERSLHCLYTLFCQSQKATLVVHKDLHNFLIYQAAEPPNAAPKIVQIHTPKGCGTRAIHLVNSKGELVEPGQMTSSTLREDFGLSLRPDFDSVLMKSILSDERPF